MANFHISRVDGVVRQCRAQTPETCTADRPSEIKEHFTNKEEAQQAYEKVMNDSNLPGVLVKKNKPNMSSARRRAHIARDFDKDQLQILVDKEQELKNNKNKVDKYITNLLRQSEISERIVFVENKEFTISQVDQNEYAEWNKEIREDVAFAHKMHKSNIESLLELSNNLQQKINKNPFKKMFKIYGEKTKEDYSIEKINNSINEIIDISKRLPRTKDELSKWEDFVKTIKF